MKKIIALLLAILLLCPLIVSCTGGNSKETVSDSVVEEESGLLLSDKIKDVKFGGEEINIWQTKTASNAAEYYYDMNGSNDGEDFVMLELYKRNVTVEEYLNVQINFIDTGAESKDAADAIRPSLQAGSTEFDAYQLVQHNGIALVVEGWFKNLDDSKYLDFSGEWWAQGFMDNAKINGHNYVMAGDVGVDMVSCAGAIFVNKNMLKENYGEDAYENLRTTVLEGKWTIDELTKLSKDMYHDLNNNNSVDIQDQFGFLSVQHNIDGFYFGAGCTTVERDNEGKAVLTIGNEYSVNVMDRLYRMMHTESPDDYGNNAGGTQLYNNLHSPTIVQKFADGEMLFSTGYFYTARNFTNMTDEFAPLPYPKFDLEQKEYHSIIHNSTTIYAIPNSCIKYDQTGATFEAMAAFGRHMVIPFYYEQVLKLRYLSEEGDTQLVDLIYDTRMSDTGVIFNTTAFFIPRYMIQYKNSNMSTLLTQNRNIINKELKSINNIKF